MTEGESELERLRAEAETKLSPMRQKLAAMTKKADDMESDAALGLALEFHGTPERLRKGVVALLREGNKLVVDESDFEHGERVAMAQTRDGLLHSPAMLVEHFLESDEGAPYRGSQAHLHDGHFTAMIQAMKGRR